MLLTSDDGYVRTITLNRPEAMNAFNGQQFDNPTEALLAAGSNTTVRVVVLTGSGRALTTGLDVNTQGGINFANRHAVSGTFKRGQGEVSTTGCTDRAYGLRGPDVAKVTSNVLNHFIKNP